MLHSTFSCRLHSRLFSCCQLPFCEFPKHTTALHYRYDMQMYCTFVIFVNQHFPGLPASGTHCISLPIRNNGKHTKINFKKPLVLIVYNPYICIMEVFNSCELPNVGPKILLCLISTNGYEI
jgi:hypothetical protein